MSDTTMDDQVAKHLEHTRQGIEAIRRECDEAIDHERSWRAFEAVCRERLKMETAMIEMLERPLP